MGFPTCFTPNGFSTVDYGLSSPALFNQIDSFKVEDPNLALSDHAPITASLKVNVDINHSNQTKYKYLPKPGKVVWNKDKSARFTILLQAPACKEVIRDFIKTGIKYERLTIDAATSFISEIIVTTAEAAEMSVKRASSPKKSQKKKT